MMGVHHHKSSGIGAPLRRKEDQRLVRGKGLYVDDIKLPGMLYLKIVRSPYASAKIKRIDTSRAEKLPGVVAVITGRELEEAGLAWMPTIPGDKQAVMAVDRVYHYAQEVAAVVAEDMATAADAASLIEVEYEPLEPLIDPRKALDKDAPIVRPDKGSNLAFRWSAGDRQAVEEAFRRADVVVERVFRINRIIPSAIEPHGCVAHYDRATGRLTVWVTAQAPHVARTVISLITKIPEHKIRVIAPDIGGGFGGKVGIYPGYVIAIYASIKTGRPVKWIATRTEHTSTEHFARDVYVKGSIASTRDGRILAVKAEVLADFGAFNAQANPSKWPMGLFTLLPGPYDIKHAYVEVTAVHTNKPPGGIAYRCSFRVPEAVYTMERLVDLLARRLNMDPAELRFKNLVPPDKFPYRNAFGLVYDSGNYAEALRKALNAVNYSELRREQEEKRRRGELMGIGISMFVEAVGGGPSHMFDIAGIKMFDSAHITVHPTGKVSVKVGSKPQGQGHETTFAQIVAEELGVSEDDVDVEHGDTDTAPYGLGTYASRSLATAGAALAVAARKIREKARRIAAHLLGVSPEQVEWERGRFYVRGSPDKSVSIQEVAFAAYTNPPPGEEPGLEAIHYYDPPNLTYPFGAYVCVVDIDRETGEFRIRRFVAVDDCGVIINPVIVDGQIHGGLTMGLAETFYEEIVYDESGNLLTPNFASYLLPSALETPRWETLKTVTPSPHHPLGAKGVGESANVGSPPAFANAVVDALSHLGVEDIERPITPWKILETIRRGGGGRG